MNVSPSCVRKVNTIKTLRLALVLPIALKRVSASEWAGSGNTATGLSNTDSIAASVTPCA
jgi:hypothetical protein